MKPSDLDVSNFSKFNLSQRREFLNSFMQLDPNTKEALNLGGLTLEKAECFVENVVGLFGMPFSLVPQFKMNNYSYVLPLVIEETSVVAALSKTSKWIESSNGSIEAKALSFLSLGQIQIPRIKDSLLLSQGFENYRQKWLDEINKVVLPTLVQRQGGARNLKLRVMDRPDSGQMAVIHLEVDTVEAMGANKINQACEYLKPLIQDYLGEEVGLCIVSNLTDSKIIHAQVKLEVEAELGEKIQEASLFAEIDPYRACTHNKGVMNGMDALLLATGNDWRAVEAGVHAYAAVQASPSTIQDTASAPQASSSSTTQSGYTAISKWRYKDGILYGDLKAPISIGTVGGVTQLHPLARFSLELLGQPSARRLACLVASVGLVQNLGALRALSTVGITQGHMRLHLQNLILNSSAQPSEYEKLNQHLNLVLEQKGYVSTEHIDEILVKMRGESSS